ncbi:hypothetical protein ACH5RR_021808 [Cinchona calisaya]|uniref:RNase H type-1 domain-containing protein n=1 Tax=Cinchona calisaya TaxID=153742 RepID=A0ABD2ZJ67_9GENT
MPKSLHKVQYPTTILMVFELNNETLIFHTLAKFLTIDDRVLRDGLLLAIEKNFACLDIEVDSEIEVHNILRADLSTQSYANIISHFRVILSSWLSFKLSHSYREANRAADILARMAVQREHPYVILENTPQEFCRILSEDLRGTAFPRIVRKTTSCF